MHLFDKCTVTVIALCTSAAWAFPVRAEKTDGTDQGEGEANSTDSGRESPAYVAPTLLFTPAASLPTLHARALMGAEAQTPAGTLGQVRPLVGGEIGLGKGLTFGAGTHWIGGGDAKTADGLTPFAQIRYQLFGDPSGHGWLGGASLTYKQVGFGTKEPEAEASFSVQYRAIRYEAGLQAVFGQSLRDGGEHDGEGRAYAGIRVLPQLLLGAAGQFRAKIGESEVGSVARDFDVIGGAMASVTFGRFQIGALAGVSTLGLVATQRAKLAPAGQLFGAYIF
ncbi:MAG: hypothetical protein NVS3B20_01970 [Polyangiales bacterium]